MKATNNKKRISLLLAAAMLISIFAGIFATTSKPTFPDVPTSHWAYASVNRASENGWIARLQQREIWSGGQCDLWSIRSYAGPVC